MIATERLILRRPTRADIPDIHAMLTDEETLRYWSFGPHKTLAETEAWVMPVIDDPVGCAFDFFIEMDGRIVGKLGCWRVPEIGFLLNRSCEGRGIASEALRAFIAYMQGRRVCDHLYADVDPANLRSKRLLERHGFRHTGFRKNTIKTHMGWCDSDDYRLDL
ncbi:MAG: GNAT family N-acetyltransferase [Alphaproteobacteria bacterium]